MGTHGSPPTRVPEVPVEWTRTARSPADLQVDPNTLSTIPVTLEDLRRLHPDSGRPAGLVAQASPLDRGGGTASRSEDRGILSVITEGFLICNRPR
jgi:hypothetical protein